MRVKFLHHSKTEQLERQQFPRVPSTGRVYELKRDQSPNGGGKQAPAPLFFYPYTIDK